MSTQLATRCRHCERALAIDESLVGKAVRCPACRQAFTVPTGNASEISTAGRNGGSLPELRSAASRNGHEPPTSVSGRIARFELRRLLGEGGFGIVYLAWDPVLERDVALKIPKHVPGRSLAARGFLSEARSAARLRHPGIVAVHESGEADGHCYIVTDYISGETLATRLSGERPPLKVAARWVAQLADALAYAHSENIVHRDVKPQNVILDAHEQPRIMDFGLAKLIGAEASLASVDGHVVGTPAYMSPEQARGAPIDQRTDVFAMGVVFWELLSGQRLFRRQANYLTLAAVVEDEAPALASLGVDLGAATPALDRILGRALSKRRDDRHAGIDELAAEIAHVAERAGWDTRAWTLQTRVRQLLSELAPSRPATAKP